MRPHLKNKVRSDGVTLSWAKGTLRARSRSRSRCFFLKEAAVLFFCSLLSALWLTMVGSFFDAFSFRWSWPGSV